MPPVADLAMAWDQPSVDPVADLAGARAQLGDTFAVASGGQHYLFVFSAAGVRAFYDLAEADASKGVADWRMLRRKIPDELFADRRTVPHDAFGRDDVARYRDALEHALDLTISELGASGTLEVFDFSRRLGHRLGLSAWGGKVFTEGALFEELTAALDVLDPSDAFVRPEQMGDVAANNKAAEYEALAVAETLIGDALDAHRAELGAGPLALIIDRWADAGDAGRQGIARDLILMHLASMSNLFAATGWLLVDLILRPDLLGQALKDSTLAEHCALESIRMAQRSIMMREVLRPVTVDDGEASYSLMPGATVATLLPLTNLDAGPGLGDYDPSRWRRRRLAHPELAERTVVTTFGHGSHLCPAQPFSLHAMIRTVQRVLGAGTFQARFDQATPIPGQIGGVGRAAAPCLIDYTIT